MKITAYHGSPEKFQAFKDSNQGKNYGHGLYFTQNKQEAQWYAGKSEKKGYIYTVEVTANKIFNVRDEKQAKELSDYLELNWPKVKKDQSWKDPGSGYTSREKDNLYIKIAGQVYEETKDYPENKMRPTLLHLGYDAIQDDEEEWIVVFSKKQAKIISTEKITDFIHLKDFDPQSYYGESTTLTENINIHVFRGYRDVLPGKIKTSHFNPEGDFAYGPGDYYALEKDSAEYYGYKHAKKFGVVVQYLFSGNAVELEQNVDFIPDDRHNLAYSNVSQLTDLGKEKLKTDAHQLKGKDFSKLVKRAGYDGYVITETGSNPLFGPMLIVLNPIKLTPISYSFFSFKKPPKAIQSLGNYSKYPENFYGDIVNDVPPENISQVDQFLKGKKVSKESLDEDFKDWNTDRWVHYSKKPYIKINPKQFHQDPAGIYLFPEKFDTEGNWEHFPYKFIVQVPSTLSILDMAQISVEEAKELLSHLPSKWKERESELEQDARSFWGILRDFYGKQKAGEWNKLLRDHGYDAVFDDTGQIHSAEVQFIVLNPTQVKVIEMIDQRQAKGSGFEELGKVMGWFEKLLSKYGEVTVTAPKKTSGAWDRTKLPRGSIKVQSGDAYATWDFVVSFVPGEKNALEGINARLGYSNRDIGQKNMSIAWTIPLDAEVLPGRVEQELKNSLGKLSVQTESIIKVPDKYDGPDVKVFNNPTLTQIKNLFTSSTDQTLKWIIDKEHNLYVWDAYFYHHREMDEKLNLQSKWSGVVEKESEAETILNLQKDSMKKPGDDKTLFGEAYWGTAGAGGVIQAQDTGRYLINHRGAETMEPNTWGTWGGKIDEGEDPKEALKREIREETGYTGPMALKFLYTFKDGDFKFYNYLITVAEEFEPELSWESQDAMWTTLDKLPKPLHFGLKGLLPYLERLHVKEDLEEKKLEVKAKFELEKTDDGFEILAYVDGEIAGNVTVTQEYIDSGGECYPFQPYEDEPFYKDICDHESVTQISILSVEKEQTGKGIATELMKRAMKEIKKRYAGDPVYINASPMGDVVGLSDLVSFYKTYGFKVLKTYPQHRNALLWKDKP